MMRRSLPWLVITAALTAGCGPVPPSPVQPAVDAVVLVSANAEWAVVKAIHPGDTYASSPFGECFTRTVSLPNGARRTVVVLHGGWGKTSAAASTQYAIDRWNPPLLVNLGTCGGFQGSIDRGAIVLAARTVIYDIIERMGDPDEAVRDYSTTIDLAWLTDPPPSPVVRTTLVSADQDLDPSELSRLKARFGAVAGDWESGAIAYVAARNHRRLLILRGVTDLVGDRSGEAYGKIEVFRRATDAVMRKLFAELPLWLERAGPAR